MAGLARHVDPDEIIKNLHDHPGEASRRHIHTNRAVSQTTPYSSRYASQQEISKFKIPHEGAPADSVHQMLKDELDLDGRPNLNLASFVGTYMEREAEALIIENLSKNMSDADEYPAMMNMHARCVSIISHLWGVQKGEKAIGTATTGSSEAIHLGGLAMKRRWQEKRRAEGKDTSKPNIIMGANAQVALEKFARYFEVESRILPVSGKSLYRLDPDLVKENIDENTIGIFVILGSTYTGHYEPVEEISKILDDFEKKTGHDIPIHVDAASGGFIAPFTRAKAGDHKWNFELPRVKSINTSGHKFGLVYAGVGWIIWRDESYLPKHLVFELHYLGGTEESYTLNFSRPGAQIIAQYFNLIHLGFSGYRSIMENCMTNARLLSKALEASGWYVCVSDIHRKKGEHTFKGKGEVVFGKDDESSADYNAGLPVVAFRLSDAFKKDYPHVKQESVSTLLRVKQYIIPNYPLPPNEEKIEILRVVVRESMSLDLLDRLIADIFQVTQTLMDTDAVDLSAFQPGVSSIEKEHQSQGHTKQNKHNAKRPMSHGPAALVVPALKRHTATVIMAHGLGDSGAGWVSLAENWRRRGKFEEVAFIFPNAPHIPITVVSLMSIKRTMELGKRWKDEITCNFGMHMPGWYDITTFSELAQAHDEPGILRSREYFNSLIKAETEKGIPSTRIVLGGFSQGGAISLFTGVTCPSKLAGIFGLSSYLLMHGKIKGLIPAENPNKDTPIFMGHGDKDQLVKYEWGQKTAQILKDWGWKVDFKTYPGLVHSADPEEIDDLEAYLKERLPPLAQEAPSDS
ncbi:hypothetical protein MMC08_007482 [Hypocenomyce scalaris]|nr:hypothetical protein [Hypocenomyce scalaris]